MVFAWGCHVFGSWCLVQAGERCAVPAVAAVSGDDWDKVIEISSPCWGSQARCYALSYLSSSSTASITGTEATQSGVQHCWLSKECVFSDKEWQQSHPKPAAGRAGQHCRLTVLPEQGQPCPTPCSSQPALYTHKQRSIGIWGGISVQNLDCLAKDRVKRKGRDTHIQIGKNSFCNPVSKSGPKIDNT